MAATDDTQSMLFERLAQIRATLEQARGDLKTLRRRMRRSISTDATGFDQAADLHAHLLMVIEALNDPINMLVPIPEYVDQRLRPALEVVRG